MGRTVRIAMVVMVVALGACGDDGTAADAAADSTMADGSGSACDPDCPSGLMCCGGVAGAACRDVQNDGTNCGGCGVSCRVDQACVAGACVTTDAGVGACVPSCEAEQTCCGGSCVDPDGSDVEPLFRREDASFFNCGGCDVACNSAETSECMPPSAGAPPECLCGGAPPCEAPTSCVIVGSAWTCAAP